MSTYFAFAIGFITAAGIFGYLLHWLRKKANMLIYDLQDVIVCNNIVEASLKRELRMARDAAQGKKEPDPNWQVATREMFVGEGEILLGKSKCPHIPITMINASSVPYSEEIGLYQAQGANWFVKEANLVIEKIPWVSYGKEGVSQGRKTRIVTLIRSE